MICNMAEDINLLRFKRRPLAFGAERETKTSLEEKKTQPLNPQTIVNVEFEGTTFL